MMNLIARVIWFSCIITLATKIIAIRQKRAMGLYGPSFRQEILRNQPADDENATFHGEGDAPRKKKRCCPYDFDSSRCRIVNDRVLCGYNKNKGAIQDDRNMTKIGERCVIKGKRVECGYTVEPYHGIRRPPAWEGADQSKEKPAIRIAVESESDETKNIVNLEFSSWATRARLRSGVTSCREEKNGIVCRPQS